MPRLVPSFPGEFREHDRILNPNVPRYMQLSFEIVSNSMVRRRFEQVGLHPQVFYFHSELPFANLQSIITQ